MSEHHYIYGSGSFGCLYDCGPNIAETKEQAVNALLQIFADIPDEELDVMKADLTRSCYHSFKSPEAGADYCEIVWQPGLAPEETDGS
jgi:hypothetical protein